MKQTAVTFNEHLLNTPLGELAIWLDKADILQFVGWLEYREPTLQQLAHYYQTTTINLQPETQPNNIVTKIADYFAGDIKAIDCLPVASFGSPFQKQVWQALRTIPAGTTTSYGELAKQLDKPLASRAVGMANHNNPIAIVVPCHRVIGKNKQLTGYAGGLERKQWLLDHERKFIYNDILPLL